MAVLFKKGKFAVKKYDELCPNSIQYIKVGKYIYDTKKDSVFMDDPFTNDYRFENVYSIPFAIGLDVDFGRDQDKCIPLSLDKNGIFHRTDGIPGKATIEDLFCKYDEK